MPTELDPRRLTTPTSGLLEDLLRRTGARWRTDDGRVRAALFFDAYAACLARPVTAALVGGGAVPDVRASACRVEIDDGGLTRAVHAEGVVTSADPLGAARRVLVDEHLLPLADALTAIASLGRAALVAMIADALTSTVLERDPGPQGCRLALELSARCAPELPGPPRFLTLDRPRGPHTVLLRRSCCLAYRLAGAVHCGACPLPGDEVRRARLELHG